MHAVGRAARLLHSAALTRSGCNQRRARVAQAESKVAYARADTLQAALLQKQLNLITERTLRGSAQTASC